MVRRLTEQPVSQPSNNGSLLESIEKHGGEFSALHEQVETLLQNGQPKQALETLTRSKIRTGWVTNATGVCLLRLGQVDRAVELFRDLVLSGKLFLRTDVPTAWKVNFATALLLSDNLSGCFRLLAEIKDEDNAGVQRLRAALKRWHSRLSLWDKVRWFLGGQPARRVELQLPGEL